MNAFRHERIWIQRNARSRRKCVLAVLGALLAVMVVVGCSAKSKEDPNAVSGGPAAQMVHDYGQDMTSSLEAGKKTECASNLSQLRQAVQMSRDANDGRLPASLADLGANYRAVETCPTSHQPYQYDASTGTVRCITPGHEKL